jgi:hypothetical protein
MNRITRLVFGLALIAMALPPAVRAEDTPADGGLRDLDMVRTWSINLPLSPGETIMRSRVVDDNLYLFSTLNRVYAVHIYTGILRWSNAIGEPGQPIRGPSHNQDYAFFTAPGSVRVIDRHTGEPAVEPRKIRGVIIEVKHDIAEINVGELHGLKGGEILNVQSINTLGEAEGEVYATVTITSVGQRSSKGRLTRVNNSIVPQAGNHVSADLALPLPEVVLPFAASGAAAADAEAVYVGAANQKFYCLEILRGVQRWSILTPGAVVAQPVLIGNDLYIAGQDGLIISCSKEEKNKAIKNWTFLTEGPIFSDLLITPGRVYAASSDRSLYCLDRKTGKRIWRERFDSPLMNAPKFCDNRIYQIVPDGGLYVLNADTGAQLWKRPEGGHFLIQTNQDVYLADDHSPLILRVDARKGTVKHEFDAGMTAAVTASDDADAIFLAEKGGAVTCLRSRFAPRLKPDDLTQVLRNDRRIRIAAEIDQARIAKVEKKPEGPRPVTARDLMFEQDWLASHSTAKPVGGHNLVEVGDEKPQAKAAKKSKDADADADEGAADEKDAKDSDEAASDDGEKPGKDAKDSDDGDSKDSKDADEESSDDSKDEKDADEDSGDKEEKDSDDDEAGDEKGDDKKGGG